MTRARAAATAAILAVAPDNRDAMPADWPAAEAAPTTATAAELLPAVPAMHTITAVVKALPGRVRAIVVSTMRATRLRSRLRPREIRCRAAFSVRSNCRATSSIDFCSR